MFILKPFKYLMQMCVLLWATYIQVSKEENVNLTADVHGKLLFSVSPFMLDICEAQTQH